MQQTLFIMNHLPLKKYTFFVLSLFLTSYTCLAQEGKIRTQVDPLIEDLVQLKTKMTKSNAFSARYKIQIYYGQKNKAAETLEEFKSENPNTRALITYQTPNYKVWVGDYRNRLEADRAFIKIKKTYKSAFIFKPKG